MKHLLVLTCFGLMLLSHPSHAVVATPVSAHKGVVVSAHPMASKAGLDILKKGGNAVDAAVATAFALSVVEPFSAGIGGGGFALVYVKSKGKAEVKALDFRERAPLAAHRDLYVDASGKVIPDASITGHRAVAVPGTVAGLVELVKKHGRLKLDVVMAAAIDLAERGFVVTPAFEQASVSRLQDLRADSGARDVFLRALQPYPAGDLLLQRDLADILRQIAQQGSKAFYQGEFAQALVADMEVNGGLITHADLRSYQATWRRPLEGRYRGLRVVSMPLPSSGGLLVLQMLALLEHIDVDKSDFNDVSALHIYIEAARRAYADRAKFMGDPAFLRKPLQGLLAPSHIESHWRSIDKKQKTPSSKLADTVAGDESEHTTHLCVVDAEGMAVSLTFTVNTVFGAAVVVPGTGVLLNNEMDDFSSKPGVTNHFGLVGNEANAIAPTKIPLSSMAPTMVFANEQLRLVVGSPGGSTIPTTVTQIIRNVVDYKMNVAEAIAAPRVHHQWLPDVVHFEPYGLDPATRSALSLLGHQMVSRRAWGNATAISLGSDQMLQAAADPRAEGVALAW